jgi:hypothetical protein
VLGAAAAHAAGVENAEVAEREDEHQDSDGETDVAIGDGEIRVVAAGDAVDEQGHDADEGGQEEGGKTGCHTHQKRRKPAEIAKRDSKENALGAGAGDIVGTVHLK